MIDQEVSVTLKWREESCWLDLMLQNIEIAKVYKKEDGTFRILQVGGAIDPLLCKVCYNSTDSAMQAVMKKLNKKEVDAACSKKELTICEMGCCSFYPPINDVYTCKYCGKQAPVYNAYAE